MSRYPERWRAPKYFPTNCSVGQPSVVAIANTHVRLRGCALQAGAHVGVWPAALSPLFDRVIAFEPLPHLWRCSIDAVRADNVLTMPCALSSSTGTVHINPAGHERFSGSSAIGAAGLEVPAIRIDDLPGALLRHLGAIFLDIEGHELEALKGAPATLQRWRPVVVVEENAKSLRVRAAGEVAALLSPLGYHQVANVGSDLIFSVRREK